jgi:hypothetical protein
MNCSQSWGGAEYASSVLIDCESFSGASDAEGEIELTIEKLLRQSIIQNLLCAFRQSPDSINSLVDFFEVNRLELFPLDEIEAFARFRSCLRNLEAGMSNKDKLEQIFTEGLKDCTPDALLFILILNIYAIDFCVEEPLSNCRRMLLFDNLDDVQDQSQVELLVNLITNEMYRQLSAVFPQLKLRKNLTEECEFSENMAIVLALRDVTHALIPADQTNDKISALILTKDLSEIFNKSAIASKRMDAIEDNRFLKLPESGLAALAEVFRDRGFINHNLMPMFNDSYRAAMRAFMETLENETGGYDRDKITYLNEYKDISKKYEVGEFDNDVLYGARSILAKLLFDGFNADKFTDSCLKRIGVADLTDRRSSEISVCRIILSYLSNYTKANHTDPNNGIPMNKLLEDLSELDSLDYKAFNEDDLKRSLINMFFLKSYGWTNLIAFRQVGWKDGAERTLKSIQNMDLDYKKTKIYYSKAGKMYLQFISSHFEYFSARCFKKPKPPLFCKVNFTETFNCLEIIEKVLEEVIKCCDALKDHNTRICNHYQYFDDFSNPAVSRKSKDYLHSHFNPRFEKDNLDGDENQKPFREYHEERIVLSHIRYIDAFRRFVLTKTISGSKLSEEKEKELNRRLIGLIRRYYELLLGIPRSGYIQKIADQKIAQIKGICEGDYSDESKRTKLTPEQEQIESHFVLRETLADMVNSREQ